MRVAAQSEIKPQSITSCLKASFSHGFVSSYPRFAFVEHTLYSDVSGVKPDHSSSARCGVAAHHLTIDLPTGSLQDSVFEASKWTSCLALIITGQDPSDFPAKECGGHATISRSNNLPQRTTVPTNLLP